MGELRVSASSDSRVREGRRTGFIFYPSLKLRADRVPPMAGGADDFGVSQGAIVDGDALLTSKGVAEHVDGSLLNPDPVLVVDGSLLNPDPVLGGFSTQVVGGAEPVLSSSLAAMDPAVQASSFGVADEQVSRRPSSTCPMPGVDSALGLGLIADGDRIEVQGSVSDLADGCSSAKADGADGSSPARDAVGPARDAVGTTRHDFVAVGTASDVVGTVRPDLAAARPAVSASKPGLGKVVVVSGMGKAGSSRSYAAVTVSDMKSDVKLSFVPPVNTNRKKHVVLCDSDCSANDFQFSLVGHFIDGSMQFAVVRSLPFRL
ncbi:hypothetical protein Dimus_010673 [Dionaea muscipula]